MTVTYKYKRGGHRTLFIWLVDDLLAHSHSPLMDDQIDSSQHELSWQTFGTLCIFIFTQAPSKMTCKMYI